MLRELGKATQLKGKCEANYHAALLVQERETSSLKGIPIHVLEDIQILEINTRALKENETWSWKVNPTIKC